MVWSLSRVWVFCIAAGFVAVASLTLAWPQESLRPAVPPAEEFHVSTRQIADGNRSHRPDDNPEAPVASSERSTARITVELDRADGEEDVFLGLTKERRAWFRTVCVCMGISVASDVKAPARMWEEIERIDSDYVKPYQATRLVFARLLASEAGRADLTEFQEAAPPGRPVVGQGENGDSRTTFVGRNGRSLRVFVPPGRSEALDRCEAELDQLRTLGKEALMATLSAYGIATSSK